MSEADIKEQDCKQPKGWGRQLREEREQRNLTLEDISSELRLDVSLIESIEDEKVDSLPTASFVKGYLRSYARMLDVDDVAIVDAYSELGIDDAPGIKKLGRIQEASSSEGGARYATWAIIAVVVVSLFAWLGSQITSTATQEKAAVTGLEAVLPASGISPQVMIESPDVIEASGVIEVPVIVEEPTVEETLPEEPVVATTPGLAQIQLQFAKDSWVEITDDRGERLFTNIGKAGTERTVEGVPPFSVLLGNAPAVKLRYNGELYDVRYNRKGVAQFVLGEAINE